MSAFLSALVLSFIFAVIHYVPVAEQQEGVGYFSFSGLLLVHMTYSLPIYLIGGVLYSSIADRFIENIKFRNKIAEYFVSFFIYGIGGVLVVALLSILSLFQGGTIEPDQYKLLILGIFASILFYHICLGWRKIISLLR